MCRGKNSCSQLPNDKSNWPNHVLLPRPAWFESQIDLFIDAVHLFHNGVRDSSIEKISEIRSEEIIDWFVEHGQMSGRHRSIGLGMPKPEAVELNERDRERSPRKLEGGVFKRDMYLCRYCGSRLIPQNLMLQFIEDLDSDVFRKGRTNLLKHGIIHLTWPVADHVLPWRLGGRTSLENLVSSCPPCNYGKDGYTIEQLGIENPFDRPIAKENWLIGTPFGFSFR